MKMRKKRISTDKLKQMRNFLPHGSNKEIARRLNLTTESVSKTLNGFMFTKGVIEEALNIIKAENNRLKILEKRYNKLIK